MEQQPKLVGLELIVRRIDSVIDVFTESFGWEVAYDGPARDARGRAVVFDAGDVAITLLQPDEDGDDILADRTPRLSQLVVGGADPNGIVDRLTELGIPTHGAEPGRRFVPPEAVEGLLGFETALMIQEVVDDPSSPAVVE
ncbi:VOC family protein [Ilumatobacter coccineus]|uniref:VOC domain-containing protein n=1 Tax=Ilumatobacter coccineus (strain NBRC 103263 / KCTC 29153 / YM16-304) TaxID=1313172 RepID=A0A6C7E9H0_ILUCY|nr:VOC family protein [Ilumatobacter coccineus]BAN00696.1 hypothetical protein YM304_03820 [Ilumatobacter coccineus YM16-304]